MSDPVVLLSTGDVVGPAGGVTDSSMVLFNGTSGKLIKGNNAVVTAAGLAILDDVNAAAQRVTLGLGNVDNTSDANKPVSTPQQTALDLKANLIGPNFTNATGNTPAQFDASTKLATTASVQRAIGGFAGMSQLNVATTLTAAAHANKIIVCGSAGSVFTLPLASTVNEGTKLCFVSRGGTSSLVPQGGDVIFSISATVASLPFSGSDWVEVSSTAGAWVVTAGAPLIGKSSGFPSLLAATGYQKLPTGLVLQWGTVGAIAADGTTLATFPLAFTTACFQGYATGAAAPAGTTGPSLSVPSFSTTQIAVGNDSNATGGARWFAIGV